MEPLGRLMYVQNASLQWVPWAGSATGSGNVVLYTPGGIAVLTPEIGENVGNETGPVLGTMAANYGIDFDSDTFRPQLNLGDDTDANAPIVSPFFAGTVARLQAFNGTNYDRLRSFAGNADNITAPTLGLLGTAAFNLVFNGTTYHRTRSVADNTDAQAVGIVGLQGTMSKAQAFNGTSYDRLRTNSAATLSSSTQPFGQLSAQPGEWSINHTPAANTQATITRAAGAAGVRHICRSISATLIGLAAAVEATVLLNLRDGTTGAGTILRSWRLLVVGGVGSETGIEISGLNIVGTAATAMTLEFAAAGGANTFETVALSGYDTL